jgi:hypothetical protein
MVVAGATNVLVEQAGLFRSGLLPLLSILQDRGDRAVGAPCQPRDCRCVRFEKFFASSIFVARAATGSLPRSGSAATRWRSICAGRRWWASPGRCRRNSMTRRLSASCLRRPARWRRRRCVRNQTGRGSTPRCAVQASRCCCSGRSIEQGNRMGTATAGFAISTPLGGVVCRQPCGRATRSESDCSSTMPGKPWRSLTRSPARCARHRSSLPPSVPPT